MASESNFHSPAQSIPVFSAGDFTVVSGANEGDGLSFADDLVLDDIYALSIHATQQRLAVCRSQDASYRIAEQSEAGTPGAALHLDCALSVTAFGGPVIEVLVLVETDEIGRAYSIYMLPLAPLEPKTEYRLVGIDTETVEKKFAQVACVSFTRGTHITLATGRQRPIEDLRPGDKVLTRDEGVQSIRWIGSSTQRAYGAFAPIRIAAGTLNNNHDLVVSPDHRLFIYQRTDTLGMGRSELLVKARHLVNGTTITVQHGGFIDYFQLLFDSHQIIYAEGIAAESMLVDDRTAPLVDAETLRHIIPDRRTHREMTGFEVHEALLQRPDAVDLLRRASKG